MKWFVSAAVIAVLLLSKPTKINNLYPDVGCIMKKPCKTVEITMQNGNRFAFQNEDGDWCKGDLVAVIMDSRGTPKVTDDRIVSVKYAGYVSKSEIKKWVK